MRRVHLPLIVLLALILLPGCGKNESSSSTATTPGAADSSDKPMAGKAPSNSSQFVGKWFATTEGAIETMEFMKEGQVLITDAISRNLGAGNTGKTLNYKVLEGGRLSMIAPDGMTAVYDVTLNGDVMEIRGDAVVADNDMQRFQRLKPGETVQQKLKEIADAKTREYRELTAGTEAFFKQKGLVLVFGSGTSPKIAVLADTTFAGGFNGKAWHDGANPHMDQISGQLVPNERERKLQLRITFGPEIAPSPGRPGTGTAMLDITGSGSSMKVAGKVQYGNTGTPMDLVLKVDPAEHDAIVKKFDAELARLEEQKKPIINALKDVAILSGKVLPSMQGQPESNDRIILVSTDKPGVWSGEGSVTTVYPNQTQTAPIAPPIVATVQIDDKQQPMLIIKSPLAEYQLSLSSGSNDKLEGGRFYSGAQGQKANFSIVSYDKATYTKMMEDQKKALAGLAGDAPYVGMYIGRNGGFSPYTPFLMKLSPAANGAVMGTVRLPTPQNATVNVAGQIKESLAGPQLTLTFSGIPQDQPSQTAAAQMRAPMSISIDENTAGTLKLTAASQSTGEFKLIRYDDATKARNKQALTDLLTRGAKFRSSHPYADQPQATIFDLKLDPATGKIAGTVPQARPNVFTANSAIVGELKDEDGLLVMALQITDPQVGNRFRATYVLNLYMHQTEKGWVGVTIYYPTHQERARSPLDILELKN